MPRLANWTTQCAIYLYESEAQANNGTRTGGSGFLFGMPMAGRGDFIYAVSNWHVIESAPVIRLNTVDDKFDVMPLTVADWYRHPDGVTDLAVAPIEFDIPANYRAMAVSHEHLLTKEWVGQFDIGIGEDLFTVGRFIDHDGKQRGQPTVRFGAIAQMPGDLIETEAGPQDAYLAELRSIAGYSGSPVFALIPPHRDKSLPMKERQAKPLGGVGGKERILLLGVDCSHMRYLDRGIYRTYRDSAGQSQVSLTDLWMDVHTGMAVVIGAWKLDELLERSDLRKMRDTENARRRKAAFPAKLDSATENRPQKTLAPDQKDRIDIPIPSKSDVMDAFKKVTRKREKK